MSSDQFTLVICCIEGIILPGKPSVPFFKATVAVFRGKVDGN